MPYRGSSTAQGYGAAWRALRAKVIRERGGICEIDGEGPRIDEAGKVVDPLDVDHVRSRRTGGTDDRANLRVVHHSEHASKTMREDHPRRRSAAA